MGESYYQRNRDQVLKKNNEWNERNRQKKREYDREWAQQNPEKVKAKRNRYRQRLKDAEGSHTEQEWTDKVSQYNNCCAYCGTRIEGMPEKDHFIPLSRGGTDYIENLLPACKACNVTKSGREPWSFIRSRIGEQPWSPDTYRTSMPDCVTAATHQPTESVSETWCPAPETHPSAETDHSLDLFASVQSAPSSRKEPDARGPLKAPPPRTVPDDLWP